MKTQDKIKVMQAYLSGCQIEFRQTGKGDPCMGSSSWEIYILGEPKWNWFLYEYRVKQTCYCCGKCNQG